MICSFERRSGRGGKGGLGLLKSAEALLSADADRCAGAGKYIVEKEGNG
jgi:hypothetical protein